MTSMRSRLTTGLRVVTSDGQELGWVKELEGTYFKVDAPMARDYWLADEIIHEVLDDCVSVAFTKDEVDDYKMKRPDPDALAPSPILDDSTDPIGRASASKAEIRDEMRNSYPSAVQSVPDAPAGTPVDTVDDHNRERSMGVDAEHSIPRSMPDPEHHRGVPNQEPEAYEEEHHQEPIVGSEEEQLAIRRRMEAEIAAARRDPNEDPHTSRPDERGGTNAR